MVQYVLDDGAAGKAHRLQKGAYRFVGRLDGERTVEQLWERLVEELGEDAPTRSEEHTSELQSLMRISYAVFCLKKKKNNRQKQNKTVKTILQTENRINT